MMDFSVLPIDPADRPVLEEIWSRRICRLRASREVVDGLRELNLKRLLDNDLLRVPYLVLFADGRMLATSDYTEERSVYGRTVQGYVNTEAVHRAVEAGATVVLSSAQHWVAELTGMTASIRDAWRAGCTASIFCTPARATGLTWHRDRQHGLVIQLEGRKVWNVERTPPTVPWREEPLGADYEPEQPQVIELEPGQVLYLPPGVAHHPRTDDQPSVHATIGIRQVEFLDVAQRLLRRLTESDPELWRLATTPAAECSDVLSALTEGLGSMPGAAVDRCIAEAEDDLMASAWKA